MASLALAPGRAGSGVRATSPVFRGLARALQSQVDELADRLVALILATDPVYADATTMVEDELRHSCRDNFAANIEALTGRPMSDSLLDAARTTGNRRAEQGFPLEHVLNSFRMGGRMLWEALLAEARASNVCSDDLLDGAAEVWEITDILSNAVAEAYRRTEAALARRDDARRQVVMDRLIDSDGEDQALLTEAAEVLELPQAGRYVVVVAEVVGGREALRRPADALAATGLRSAWRLRADREIGIVALGGVAVETVVGVLAPRARGRIGISPVVSGLSRVGAGHRFGHLAMCTGSPRSVDVVQLSDRLPEALLAASPDLAALLVSHVLGPVMRLEAGDRASLLESLDVVLACGGSIGQAAEKLSCHRNTVHNRIRRLEALTGRSLDDLRDLLPVGLAVAALHMTDSAG